MKRYSSTKVHENNHLHLVDNSRKSTPKKRKILLDFCVNIDGNPAGFEKMKKRLSRLEYKINGCL